MNDSTHLIYEGSQITISPDLYKIYDFLHKIENEINGLLTVEKRLKELRQSLLETMLLCEHMSKIITDNHLEFEYKFEENSEQIARNLEAPQLTRVEIITLFAYLETLICLYLAYDNETSDEKTIMIFSKDSSKTKKIINKLILNDANEHYAKNRSRLTKVSAQKLRDLRNKLSHFFSVSGSSLVPNALEADAREIELNLNFRVSFISPNDLSELLKFASLLLFKKWSNDYQVNSVEFERKISFVKTIVERDGAVLVYKK